MYSVGSIILIKNIVFKNGNKCFDHAYKYGRPCLIISLLNDNIYYVPLSSSLDFKKINESDIIISSKYCRKKSKISLKNIYFTDGYYYEEKEKFSDEDLLPILKKLYKFQTSHISDSLFNVIMADIQNTIDELSNRVNNTTKLVYKL